MRDAIRTILARHGKLAVDATGLDADTDLYGCGLTSHATVATMLALEDEFDVEFPDDMLRKSTFATVADIERTVRTLRSAAGLREPEPA